MTPAKFKSTLGIHFEFPAELVDSLIAGKPWTGSVKLIATTDSDSIVKGIPTRVKAIERLRIARRASKNKALWAARNTPTPAELALLNIWNTRLKEIYEQHIPTRSKACVKGSDDWVTALQILRKHPKRLRKFLRLVKEYFDALSEEQHRRDGGDYSYATLSNLLKKLNKEGPTALSWLATEETKIEVTEQEQELVETLIKKYSETFQGGKKIRFRIGSNTHKHFIYAARRVIEYAKTITILDSQGMLDALIWVLKSNQRDIVHMASLHSDYTWDNLIPQYIAQISPPE